MSRIGKLSLTVADIVPPEATLAEVRYDVGHNCTGTGHFEVMQLIRRPDGSEGQFVIMRGLSRAKTEAIVMILNAPEV
jgi:hypothetical protein